MRCNCIKKEITVERGDVDWNGHMGGYCIVQPTLNTIYLFKRHPQSDNDGNPVVKALLSLDDWRFCPQGEGYDYTIGGLLLQIPLLQRHFDVLLTVKTDCAQLSKFYEHLKPMLSYSIHHKVNKDQHKVTEITDSCLPDNFLRSQYTSEEEWLEAFDKFDSIMDTMYKDNKDIFAFRYFKDHPNRDFICDWYDILFWDSYVSELHKDIDNKDVLILDDTMESGAPWSKWAEMTWRMFEPRSIAIVNFFTPKEEDA